jgi:hypothetical protein
VYGERVEVEQAVRAVVSDKPMSEEEWIRKHSPGHAADGPPA